MSQSSPRLDPVNRFCPRSGKPVARDSLTEYRGVAVGFCNPGCRDDFAAHVDDRPGDRAYFDALLKERGGSQPRRAFLRHTLAAMAYRAEKPLREAPPEFAHFRASETTRTPAEILAHMGDLMDWAWGFVQGQHVWADSPVEPWEAGVERFFAAVAKLDEALATAEDLGFSEEVLFQGPIADALNHVGQLALLRRMAGSPILGENYATAEIVAGRVGREQSSNRREFE